MSKNFFEKLSKTEKNEVENLLFYFNETEKFGVDAEMLINSNEFLFPVKVVNTKKGQRIGNEIYAIATFYIDNDYKMYVEIFDEKEAKKTFGKYIDEAMEMTFNSIVNSSKDMYQYLRKAILVELGFIH